MRFAAALLPAVLVGTLTLQTAASSQGRQTVPPKSTEPPQEQADQEEPTPAPLAVASMAIASSAALFIEAMAVDVTIDRIAYTYRLRNDGPSELSLAASVAEPDLEVNSDGTTVYLLPNDKADDVVGLQVTSNGKSIPTTPRIQAVALGINRSVELTNAGIPLIPFGEATDKALAGANPEMITKLEGLGLVAPRDPSQPDVPIIGDWSLHVVRGWTQKLSPKVSTEVIVGFSPIKAVYTIDASNLSGFDELKDAACLTPQFMNSVRALLAAKGSTVDVADILIANDGPARWRENPPARVAIHKPTPDSIVSFCGLDPKTQKAPIVTGAMPSSSEAAALRVLIFARTKQ